MPANIHRTNVLWYNRQLFADNNLDPSETWEDFFKAADLFKSQGVIPLVIGAKEGWEGR